MQRRCNTNLIVAVLGVLTVLCLPIHAQQRTVTRVVALARPKAYNGPAPATIEFVGTMVVSRYPVTVDYQWERSDGAKSGRKQIEIRTAGQEVTDTWKLGTKGKHLRVWEKLHVLAPTGISSVRAVATINCH